MKIVNIIGIILVLLNFSIAKADIDIAILSKDGLIKTYSAATAHQIKLKGFVCHVIYKGPTSNSDKTEGVGFVCSPNGGKFSFSAIQVCVKDPDSLDKVFNDHDVFETIVSASEHYLITMKCNE